MRYFTWCLFLSLPCFATSVLCAEEPIRVSLVQLIANPEKYDGKVVFVVGFVSLEFEGSAIYLHEEDYKHALYRNGLWIDIPNDMRRREAGVDRKYVMIIGTFNAKELGHKGAWSGSIQKITKFRVRD